jgi:hypothetical protein
VCVHVRDEFQTFNLLSLHWLRDHKQLILIHVILSLSREY